MANRQKIYDRRDLKRRISRGEVELKPSFNKLTKVIRAEIDSYRSKPWLDLIDRSRGKIFSARPLWSKINLMRGKSSQSIPPIRSGDQLVDDDKEKANVFRRLLSETFSPSDDSSFDDQFKQQVEEEVMNFALLQDANKLMGLGDSSWQEVSLPELDGVLASLNSHSAPGPDGVHNQMLQHLPQDGRMLLLRIVNKSLKDGSLATRWKEATVIIIPKKKLTNDASKYRPISLTSCVGKLVEKLVTSRLAFFLESKNIIKPYQSGFRRNRSSNDNLTFLTQKAAEALDQSKSLLTVFLEVEKAFNKTWHAGIIKAMIDCNVPSYLINWTTDFLNGRSFSVT